MKRKYLVGLVALVIAVASSVGLCQMYAGAEEKVESSFRPNVVIDASDYQQLTKEQLIQISQADEIGKVKAVNFSDEAAMADLQPGIYTANLTIQLNFNQEITRTVTINVWDKQGPTVTAPKSLEVTVGDKFPVAEVAVVDAVDGKIASEDLEVTDYDAEKVGKQQVTLTATDRAGNKSATTVSVKVVADVAEESAIDEAAVETKSTTETTETFEAETSGFNEEIESEKGVVTEESTTKTTSEDPVVVAPETKPATTTNDITETTPIAEKPDPVVAEVSVLKFAGQSVSFAQANGAIAAPESGVGTWMGSGSVSDGAPTHFIGHNPGDFSGVMGLGVGSTITVIDASGASRTYTVYEVLDVTDDGYNNQNPQDDVLPRMLYDGGERISLQTCISDTVNRCVLAR